DFARSPSAVAYFGSLGLTEANSSVNWPERPAKSRRTFSPTSIEGCRKPSVVLTTSSRFGADAPPPPFRGADSCPGATDPDDTLKAQQSRAAAGGATQANEVNRCSDAFIMSLLSKWSARRLQVSLRRSQQPRAMARTPSMTLSISWSVV